MMGLGFKLYQTSIKEMNFVSIILVFTIEHNYRRGVSNSFSPEDVAPRLHMNSKLRLRCVLSPSRSCCLRVAAVPRASPLSSQPFFLSSLSYHDLRLFLILRLPSRTILLLLLFLLLLLLPADASASRTSATASRQMLVPSTGTLDAGRGEKVQRSALI